MKISQKLILGFISIALLVAIVGYISIDASQKALQTSIGQASASLAAQMLDHIDRSVYRRIETCQEYSRDLITRQIVSKSNSKFDKLDNIQTYINQQDHKWTSVPKQEITPFMQELINNELSEELRERIEFYEEKYDYKVIGEIFITNKYGTNVAQSGKTSDYYQADEKWWQNAEKDGLYIGALEYDESADIYSTAICVRVEDEDGKFAGVIKAVLNINETIKIIQKKEDEAIEFKLLNKDGKLIYATEEHKFLEPVSAELLSHFYNHEEGLSSYFVSAGDKPGEGNELFAHAHSKGYKDYKSLEWILVAEQETERIFAPIAKLRNRILTASALITTLAIIIGLLIYRSISSPIYELAAAAAKIGEGKLKTHIEVRSSDEMAHLAHAFNKMTEDLQKTTTSIEELNDEITERKKAEEAMERLNEDLKTTVAELTVANRNLVDFAHIAAHDLKEPLRIITLLADCLLEDYVDKLEEQGKAQIESLSARARKMGLLINGILQYSKLGPVINGEKSVNLNEVVAEAICNIAPPKNIEITKENDFPTVVYDETQMIQVFQNLIGNSIKYMDKPQGKIKITCVREKGFWKFSVADNGCGIEKQYYNKIFQIFQTLARRDDVKGTGIGLSLVRKIVEMYNGKIWIQSTPGQGSTFFFTLPIQEAVVRNQEFHHINVS